MRNKYSAFIFVLTLITLIGCEKSYVPKPRGFQRIDFPEHTYKFYDGNCGFNANIPTYAEVYQDSMPYAEKCWFNMYYFPFNATLHLSYKDISDRAHLNRMIEDSRTLVYKHTIKADEIYETIISNKYLNGMLYNLSGNTATNFQFYVTDSTKHFLRGSLYFNQKTNSDSIEPVLNYLESDIIKMIESIRWK